MIRRVLRWLGVLRWLDGLRCGHRAAADRVRCIRPCPFVTPWFPDAAAAWKRAAAAAPATVAPFSGPTPAARALEEVERELAELAAVRDAAAAPAHIDQALQTSGAAVAVARLVVEEDERTARRRALDTVQAAPGGAPGSGGARLRARGDDGAPNPAARGGGRDRGRAGGVPGCISPACGTRRRCWGQADARSEALESIGLQLRSQITQLARRTGTP